MESSAAAGAAMIETQGLGHTYKGGHVALESVDLALGTGLYGLLGPNGAGKSTLMRIICTLLVPSSGTARVCGHDVTQERRQVREQIGYLPQEFGAWRNHRAEEVLDTLARLSGLADKRERRRRVAETLELVGLDSVADRKVKKLSGGMVRRLGVAQAMVHEPRVLIVDEPTVGLDPEERMRFRQVMGRPGPRLGAAPRRRAGHARGRGDEGFRRDPEHGLRRPHRRHRRAPPPGCGRRPGTTLDPPPPFPAERVTPGGTRETRKRRTRHQPLPACGVKLYDSKSGAIERPSFLLTRFFLRQNIDPRNKYSQAYRVFSHLHR